MQRRMRPEPRRMPRSGRRARTGPAAGTRCAVLAAGVPICSSQAMSTSATLLSIAAVNGANNGRMQAGPRDRRVHPDPREEGPPSSGPLSGSGDRFDPEARAWRFVRSSYPTILRSSLIAASTAFRSMRWLGHGKAGSGHPWRTFRVKHSRSGVFPCVRFSACSACSPVTTRRGLAPLALELAAPAPRGPDWSGVHVDDGAILVRAPAIVDPAGGSRSLRSADGRLCSPSRRDLQPSRTERDWRPYALQTGRTARSSTPCISARRGRVKKSMASSPLRWDAETGAW